jgi:ribosomal protein S1
MQDLLKRVVDIDNVKVGDQLAGTVISVTKNEVLINLENIGIGIVRGKELYNEEFLSRVKVGADIEAIVLETCNQEGYLEMSFRAIGRDQIWTEIQEAYEAQVSVGAKIKDANRGGFIIQVSGVNGFLPASLLAPAHAIKSTGFEDKSLVNQMKKYVGQSFNVKIINTNPESENIIVSEKAVADEIAQARLAAYKVGDIVEGEVVGTVDFGIFVRFDEMLEGLVHISEIAWKKIEDPRTEYTVGDKLKAKIIDIDKDNRINLSIKQTLSNPWVEFSQAARPGDKFTGKVNRIVSYGAIIINEDDIQGLIHISQMSEEPLESPAKIHDLYTVGQTVTANILVIDNGEKLYLTRFDSLEKANEILEQQNALKAEQMAREAAELDQAVVEAA